MERPATIPRGDQQRRITVSFVVRFTDLLWLYLGTQGSVIATLPGVIGLPLVAALPVPLELWGNFVVEVAFCVVLIVLAPIWLSMTPMGYNGTQRLISKRVELVIDEHGVRGWPVPFDAPRSWEILRCARDRGGVFALRFQERPGFRRGWIVVPKRAFRTHELADFEALLVAKGAR